MNKKAVGFVWLIIIVGLVAGINAQDMTPQLKNTPFAKLLESQSGIGGNSISDLLIEASPAGDIIWAGTGDGLSRFDPATGEWTTFTEDDGLGKGSVSAISQNGDEIWVATGFDSSVATGGSTWYGGGLAYTSDDGQSWTHIVQPGETRVAGQNVTWDIAFLDDTIWITSWGGGLRKSMDHGETWNVVTPDGFVFDAVHNNNHNSWAVKSFDGALWVGTADGVNKSLDNGNTWTQFTHQNQD
ncbi:hypothetical protein KAH55_04275 [bacterium]|nr:hypothetical protein [bacterium]